MVLAGGETRRPPYGGRVLMLAERSRASFALLPFLTVPSFAAPQAHQRFSPQAAKPGDFALHEKENIGWPS